MTTKARREQKRVERKIYNAIERAERAQRFYDELSKARSRGKT